MLKRTAVATVLLLAGAGCAKGEKATSDSTTQRQRDSAVANSGLPGANGVGRAMGVQDSAASRNATLDSIARSDSQ